MNNMMEVYLNESNKLDGSNYCNWKFKLQNMLEEHSAWGIKARDDVKPIIAAGVIVATVKEWEKRENKVRTMLKMETKDCIIPHIRDCKSTNEIWKNLKPSSAKFSPPWRNLTQWIPLLPKEGGMIQVYIGGHPPIPFGPGTSSVILVFSFNQNLVFLAVFQVMNFWSCFEALMI